MIVRKSSAHVPLQVHPPKHAPIEKRAYRIDEFCSAYGLGRTKVYELIKCGKLRTVLVDGRRLVLRDADDALLAGTDVS